MKFEEALKHLRDGKKIRRLSWMPESTTINEYSGIVLRGQDLLSDDWTVVENKVEITREQLIEAYNKTDEEYGYLCITDLADRLGL